VTIFPHRFEKSYSEFTLVLLPDGRVLDTFTEDVMKCSFKF
jgi:hypothetical protein